jgi:hypothetical protein
MAYRKKPARRTTYKKRYTPKKRRVTRRRAAPARAQVIKLVIEQAAPSVAQPAGVVSAREVAPKKAKF